MFKGPIISGIIFAVIIMAIYFAWLFMRGRTAMHGQELVLSVGSAEYTIEIADTPATQAKGLSGRESLDIDRGMLFIFPGEVTPTFWMKGMNFPIDIIWIKDGKVTGFEEQAPKPSATKFETFSPEASIDWVLEVNAGEVAKQGIEIGDSVKFKK